MRRRNENFFTAMHAVRQDYAMASESRYRRQRVGVTSAGAPGDWHFRNEAALIRSREYVRDMVRNDAAIGPTVEKAVQQQIQDGFRLDPQTGDKQLDLDLWQRWEAWATDADQCDIAGELTFAEMQSVIFEASLVDGDCFAAGTVTGHLQIHEADLIRTPTKSQKNIVFGVELSDHRRHLTYWRAKDPVGTERRYERLYDFDPIDVRSETGIRQAFHVYNRKRVTMTRGVTALKAVVDLATMFDDTNFALSVKQQFASALVWFMKRGPGYQQPGDTQFGTRLTEDRIDGTRRLIETIEPGQYVEGNPGEDLELKAAGIQSTEALQHLRFILQLIGMNLGMPLVLVLLDAKETNFSGWRAAMDMARLGFRLNQQSLIRRLHTPVYRFKQQQWIEEDHALARAADKMGSAFFVHRWHTPTWPYINPLDDVKANAQRLTTGLASERQIAAEDGRDYDDIVDEHVADRTRTIGLAIKAADKITSETGVPVSWRDVLNQDLPKGGAITDAAELPNANEREAANAAGEQR